ncbi:OPT oligopeptide transporter protein-domain-containing protein [Lipomyces chichibuensis]|uniref:OPT oligopeptide transporter protein-domain-containing protein n=1 Tax=Lipomyces chichibuensis TaxID=1546026 RepID=UPI0033442AE7
MTGVVCGLAIMDLRSSNSNEKSISEIVVKEPTIGATEKISLEERDRISEQIRERLGTFTVGEIENDNNTDYILSKAIEMSLEKGLEILRQAAIYHTDDLNFPEQAMAHIQNLIGNAESEVEAVLIDSFSPYPEVRAVCDPYDDETIPVETIRSYFLGVVWVVIGCFVNSFFSWRQPSLHLQSTAIQLLLYPCGRAMQLLPDWGFTVRGKRISINPGPWTNKEQMFCTLMVNVAAGSSNFMNYVVSQKLPVYYDQPWVTVGYIMIVNLSSTIIGFGWAGILRRWVIYPTKSMWPTILPTLTLNRALLVPETQTRVNGWSMSKYKFFFVCFGGMFLYFFLPGYVFTAMSDFNWITWIAPKNLVLAMVASWVSVPLVIPVFATLNNYIGMLFGGVAVIALYWTNYRWGGYLPINSNQLWTNHGTQFNVSKVLTDGLLDEEKYQSYSPPYMSSGNLVYLGGFFMMYTMSFTYILLTEYKVIREAFVGFYLGIKNRKASTYERYNDPMSRMMIKYKEVPDWWFLVIFVISFVLFIIGITHYPTHTPVSSIIVTMLTSFAMLIPIAIIYSVTGFNLRMNNLSSVISGYMLPGNGNANLLCRLIGINTDTQADSFVSDLKLAHYAKIPPRAAFRGQILGTIIQCFLTVGIIIFQMNTIPGFCTATQVDKFTCAGTTTIYADSVLFGVIGPQRLFSKLYPPLKYSFLIGFLVVPPFWYLRKLFPKQLRYVHPVLLCNGAASWGSSYSLVYFTPGVYASLGFMWYIRRRYFAWWSKYNYILTSAFSTGVALCGVVIYFAFQYKAVNLKWWGNTISHAGVDGARKGAILAIPSHGFGLEPGNY